MSGRGRDDDVGYAPSVVGPAVPVRPATVIGYVANDDDLGSA